MPKQIRRSIPDSGAVISGARAEVKRQTGADQIKTETITRFTRRQVIQLALLVALVYVAYPFISTVPTPCPCNSGATPMGPKWMCGSSGSK